MNITGVIEELKKKYPGKKILLNNRQNCTVILCEIDPTSAHPSYSEAIAVIDKSNSHSHNLATETFTVIKGALTLIVDGRKYVLNAGQSYTVEPGQIHEAFGDETWIKERSKPGWKKSDHKLVK